MQAFNETAALAQVKSNVLTKASRSDSNWTVGMVERAILERYPREDAESWDRMGILVGDPNAQVTGIAVALDPTVGAIREAAACGANVLLTHHPAFLDAPTGFHPVGSSSFGSGSVVWEAISSGVALINAHTALDVSADAARMLPGLLGLVFREIVYPATSDGRGYGQLCAIRPDDAPLTLRTLAARCLSVFGRPARVWGDYDARIESVVTATGSAGGLVEICASRGYDCLICGETKYHNVLSACETGLCVIELGHDVSELPLCAILASALVSVGYPERSITILDQSTNWCTPEAVRK